MKSLRTQLLLLLCLISLIPMIFLGFMGYNYSSQLMKTQLENSTQKQLQQVDNSFSVTFNDINQDVQYLAHLSTTETAQHQLPVYTKMTGTIVEKNLPTEQTGAGDVYRAFALYAKYHPDTAYVYLGTTDGGYVQWPNLPTPGGYDPRNRPWYIQSIHDTSGVKRTEPYSYNSPTGLETIVSTTTPVKNAQGQTIGVLGIDRSLSTLSQTVKNIKIGKSGYMFVFSQNGTVIADPNDNLTFSTLKQLNDGTAKSPITNKPVSFKIPDYNLLMKNKSGFFQMNVNGQPSYVVLYTSKSTGWKMVAVLSKSELSSYTRALMWKLILVAALIMAAVLVIGFIIARLLTNPVLKLQRAANRIASGDLTDMDLSIKASKELTELAQDMTTMNNQLRTVLINVSESAEQVAGTSEQLSASANESTKASEQVTQLIQDVSEGANRQLAQTENIHNVTMAMSANMDVVTNAMLQVKSSIEHASTTANTGNEIMRQAKSQMESIDAGSQKLKDVVDSLVRKSGEIGDIVSLITQISGQTNLLSLNARIEAARAGQAGTGFAVVADEIRKLAVQSSESAERIKSIIEEIQQSSTLVSSVVQEANVMTGHGMKSIEAADSVFLNISSDVEQTVSETQKVHDAIHDMNENVQTMVEAIQRIVNISDMSARHSSEVAASSEEQLATMQEITSASNVLAEMAQNLLGQMEKFKL